MGDELLESIRAANQEFQQFIELASSGANGQEVEEAIRKLSRVHLRLKHVSKCSAAAPKSFLESYGGAGEIQKYHENLMALKGVVEKLQDSLLAKRSLLNSRRSNVQAARAWADTARACY